MDAFLLDPGRRWDGGPFAGPARRLLVPRTAAIAQLAADETWANAAKPCGWRFPAELVQALCGANPGAACGHY